MNYRKACIKNKIEQIFIFPLVFLGKMLGVLYPLKQKSSFFLFFPSDAIGGATKVNIDILDVLRNHNSTIFFSKKYQNNAFAAQFIKPNVDIIDLRNKVDNKIFYFMNIIYRGILSTWINNSDSPTVFGGESIYFYKVIPYLKKHVKIIELSHLNTWLNYNQAFVKYIDLRVCSTINLQRDMENQYRTNKIPTEYYNRLTFIDNWVEMPHHVTSKELTKTNSVLNILYVGRGATQKRVHIISKIAEMILENTKEVAFTFVGDVKKFLSDCTLQSAEIIEYIDDKNKLYSFYEKADILILTSAYEGLPIVVMDMMVRGKVVLSTAVDGIPDYIEHKKTGLLIYEINDEAKIVDEAVSLIYEMKNDRALLHEIGNNALIDSHNRFAQSTFEAKYKQIFCIK